MLRKVPDLKIAVLIRDPEGFYRSCIKMERKKEPSAFFIKNWDWGFYFDEKGEDSTGRDSKWHYDRYWYDSYKIIYDQLKEAHREPDYVWELGKYGRGEYVDQLLDWWDIPNTDENRERAYWYCTEPGNKLHKTTNTDPVPLPDLSYCQKLWEFWRNLA